MNSQHQGPRIFLMVTCIVIAGALAACGGEQTATNTAPMVDRAGPLQDDTPQTNGITAEALATYTRELADDSMLVVPRQVLANCQPLNTYKPRTSALALSQRAIPHFQEGLQIHRIFFNELAWWQLPLTPLQRIYRLLAHRKRPS